MEVAKYEALPKGCKQKFEADMLRKKGNFLHNVDGNKIKPVCRPNEIKDAPSANDYLSCKHCFGMYKKSLDI